MTTKLPTYDKYKPSGVEWLGEIPEHWEVVRLKDVCLVNQDSLSEDTKKSYEMDYVDIGSVTFENGVTQTEKYIFKNAPSRARRRAKAGDTIISTVRTYLKAIDYINEQKSQYIFSTGFAILQPVKINSFFLSFTVKSDAFTNQVDVFSTGMSYPTINSTNLCRLYLAVPSPSEQTAIAQFLDRKTALIDQAIDIKQKQIELLKERRQILIHQAVTRGLNPEVKMKDSGVEWIGEVPEGWEVVRLKTLGKIRYGLGQPPKTKEDGLPLIRATNVERGRIVEKDLIFVDPEDIPWERDPMLKENDIIVVRSGAYTGDSAIIPKHYAGSIAGYDMVLTPTSINPRFLSYTLLAKYVLYDQLYLLRMRAAQPHLNAEELGQTIIVCPPKLEQQQIFEYLKNISKKIATAITLKQQEIAKLQEYKATLINSAVTGKIKVGSHAQ